MPTSYWIVVIFVKSQLLIEHDYDWFLCSFFSSYVFTILPMSTLFPFLSCVVSYKVRGQVFQLCLPVNTFYCDSLTFLGYLYINIYFSLCQILLYLKSNTGTITSSEITQSVFLGEGWEESYTFSLKQLSSVYSHTYLFPNYTDIIFVIYLENIILWQACFLMPFLWLVVMSCILWGPDSFYFYKPSKTIHVSASFLKIEKLLKY